MCSVACPCTAGCLLVQAAQVLKPAFNSCYSSCGAGGGSGSNPDRGKRFSVLQNGQAGSGVHPEIYVLSTEGFISRVLCGWDIKRTTSIWCRD
jgi:hypothetical protein